MRAIEKLVAVGAVIATACGGGGGGNDQPSCAGEHTIACNEAGTVVMEYYPASCPLPGNQIDICDKNETCLEGACVPKDPDPTECQPDLSCAQCVTLDHCGWCEGLCTVGTASGPSSGSCANWSWMECIDNSPPPAPTDFRASLDDPGGVRLTWTAPADTSRIWRFRVDVETACTSGGGQEFNVAPPGTEVYDDTFSDFCERHYTLYSMTLTGMESEHVGPIRGGLPYPPPAPGNFTASTDQSDGVHLSWDLDVERHHLASFTVFRADSPDSEACNWVYMRQFNFPTTDRAWLDDGAPTDRDSYYWIHSVQQGDHGVSSCVGPVLGRVLGP